jgi:predicted MFS family arabinose efflux permease
MGDGRGLRGGFGWLWAAYAVSTFGTYLAFDAFSLVAIIALHAGPAKVSLLASAGLAVAAVAAIPLGPWVERRRKRAVMVAMDLVRCAALVTIPVAYWLGALRFGQLVAVAVVVGAADIAFKAASGACVKALVPPGELLRANGRLEQTLWTSIVAGPPLGGALVGLFGPVTTVLADAASYVGSAAALRRVPRGPAPAATPRVTRAGDLLDGWRHILGSPDLRPLFFNTILVGGLIMATAPLMAVLMLGRLGFAPWQYAVAFGIPCVGGLVGARLSKPLVARWGADRVLKVAGSVRACWTIPLALIPAGLGGILLVIAVQTGLVTTIGIFNPVYATRRLELTPDDRVARTLSAWSVSSSASIAALTALWGILAAVIGLRGAVAAAGVAMLFTPLLLRRVGRAQSSAREKNDSALRVLVVEPLAGAIPRSASQPRSSAATWNASEGAHFVDSSTIREPSG